MSIFSALRAGLSRVKSAVASVGSRIKSAVTGSGRQAQAARRDMPVPGETSPAQPQAPTYDDLKAPTTQEIKDARYRFKASHAGTELSDYDPDEVDSFYAATRKVWENVPSKGRNDAIRDYFEEHYGMDDLEEIYQFVTTGEIPDSDDMVQYDEQAYGDDYSAPALLR